VQLISPHFPRPIAAFPIPVFVAVVGVLNAILPAHLGPEMVYNPAWLVLVLQTVFIFATSCLVAYISLRSYLSGGSRGILLLGCGSLAWGLANLIAAFFFNIPGGTNVVVTIVSTAGLLASLLHVTSATSTITGFARDKSWLKARLAVGYTGVIVFVAVLTVLAILGLTPAFFVAGSGTTILRQTIVIVGVSLFALASLIFARMFYASKSGILFWYSMALALTATGLAASFFGRAAGDPIAWVSRIAIYLGGIYFLITVWSAFHPSRSQIPGQA